VIERWGGPYPELLEHADLIRRIVISEEERFGATLRQGLAFLAIAIERTKAAGADVLNGAEAFALHDTYGFPYELTSEIAAEAGLSVDEAAFTTAMDAQRERARAAVKDESWSSFGSAFDGIARSAGPTEFVGYAGDEAESAIVGLVTAGGAVDRIEAGAEAEIVLAVTPFYAEQGGQVGDTGTIVAEGARFVVTDTHFPVPGVIAHVGRLESGSLSVGGTVLAAIDVLRRERIRRNHTATHVLHWALRLILGDHVRQSGSLVAPDRLRFDFTHFESPGADQLRRIEEMANRKIMENHPVRNYETSLATAREMGVTALFGEKYGEIVRVLEVGNFSKELCGGTHIARSSEIGFLKIVSEGSVGANLRRIEAVTSFDALEYVYAEEDVLGELNMSLKTRTAELPGKVVTLQRRAKDAEQAARTARARGAGGEDVEEWRIPAGYVLKVGRVDGTDAGALREIADGLRGSDGAVLLVGVNAGAVLLLAAGTDAAVSSGFDAGALIKAMAPHVGGGGGGKPQMAQAGGKNASGIDAALTEARALLGVG
jgi:alanyl-tRNA synthetase